MVHYQPNVCQFPASRCKGQKISLEASEVTSSGRRLRRRKSLTHTFNHQVLRLNFNDTAAYFCEEAIQEDVDEVNGHEGGLDFNLNAYPWLLIKFWNHPLLVEAVGGRLRQNIVDALTNLPMWFVSYSWGIPFRPKARM